MLSLKIDHVLIPVLLLIRSLIIGFVCPSYWNRPTFHRKLRLDEWNNLRGNIPVIFCKCRWVLKLEFQSTHEALSDSVCWPFQDPGNVVPWCLRNLEFDRQSASTYWWIYLDCFTDCFCNHCGRPAWIYIVLEVSVVVVNFLNKFLAVRSESTWLPSISHISFVVAVALKPYFR